MQKRIILLITGLLGLVLVGVALTVQHINTVDDAKRLKKASREIC